MSGIASRRKALRGLETLKLGKWLLGTSDRRGQDKSRKVRPVGRLENAGDFKHAPNVATILHNLPFLPRSCSCSAFDTLWLMR